MIIFLLFDCKDSTKELFEEIKTCDMYLSEINTINLTRKEIDFFMEIVKPNVIVSEIFTRELINYRNIYNSILI